MSSGDFAVVGRQGIYDEFGMLGYELLFRTVEASIAGKLTRDQMTAEVVYGAVSLGLNRVAGNQLIFFTVGRGVMVGEIPLLLSPDRTVLEIRNDVEVDDQVLEGCEKLVEAGYRLALDDFTTSAAHRTLLSLASIAKIDLQVVPRDELAEVVELCRAHDVRPLATRVEDRADLDWLKALGFQLFQGSALDRPVVIQGRALDPSDAVRLNAAADLMAKDPDYDEIEKMLKHDPVLAHQVMALASMGRMGEMRRRFSSIRDALVMAGMIQVRKWLALLLARPAGEADEQARDGFLQTLVRARVCELVVRSMPGYGADDADAAFTAGMLSALDQLLGVPSTEVAAQLTLSYELREAAFGDQLPLSKVVRDVADHAAVGLDRSAGVDGEVSETRSGVSIELLDDAFATAFAWAFEIIESDEL